MSLRRPLYRRLSSLRGLPYLDAWGQLDDSSTESSAG